MVAPRRSEALILGGGLAGSAMAIHLARANHRVTLIEQHAAPHHKVCGEFLSREAVHYLSALGVDLSSQGAVPISHVRLARRDLIAAAALPFPAMSLSRRKLDEILLQHAAAAGATVYRGQRIQSINQEGGANHEGEVNQESEVNHEGEANQEGEAQGNGGRTWRAQLADGTTLGAPTVFLATGKHDLRDHARPPSRQNDLIAFKQYFRLAPGQAATLADHVELILFPGGYAGLQPVEADPDGAPVANLCLLIRRSAYARLASWPNLLDHIQQYSRHLARRLASAIPLLERPLALSGIPYGHLPSTSEPRVPSLWRLGDQTAVIPSFSGDGMSIALHTAALAATLYLQGRAADDYHARLHDLLRRQMTVAMTLSRTLVAAPSLAAAAARVFPSLLSRAATATRISESALL